MIKSHGVIKEMQLTEKGTMLQEKENQYFFKVDGDANKHDVKRAIEQLFDVSVKDVRTMNYSGKKKRQRSVRFGKRSDWKRAIVTLNEGSEIDLT